MVTRKVKPTIVHTPASESVLGAVFDEVNTTPEFTMVRAFVAITLGLAAGGAASYVALQLVALAVGAAALTGSMFLVFMILYMGIVLAVISSAIVTGKVQTFVLEGGLDKTYEQACSFVAPKLVAAKNWFGNIRSSIAERELFATRTVH